MRKQIIHDVVFGSGPNAPVAATVTTPEAAKKLHACLRSIRQELYQLDAPSIRERVIQVEDEPAAVAPASLAVPVE